MGRKKKNKGKDLLWSWKAKSALYRLPDGSLEEVFLFIDSRRRKGMRRILFPNNGEVRWVPREEVILVR